MARLMGLLGVISPMWPSGASTGMRRQGGVVLTQLEEWWRRWREITFPQSSGSFPKGKTGPVSCLRVLWAEAYFKCLVCLS